ncbi:MAG TPA: virulence factor BrkB family protein, partial [Candidatus Tenderia electrophaga]|nr:virulence factor BrkB family protein [Candidatus Tenderia electrophaga]
MSKAKQLFDFVRALGQAFYDDRCLRSSAALTYTTLLSLVPLSTVIFSVFAAFPMFDSVANQIQGFIFENFVPTSGNAIQHYLEEFSSKASQLTAIGAAFLIISALLLMNTIEGAMNDIWHIKSSRKAIPKFIVYWAMLTLGPILVGASIAFTSYLSSLPLISDLTAKLLFLLPFFASTLACTLLYAVVPNTYVPIRHAFTGAVVAAILFEIAKKTFALYITAFPTYEMIYGALATIPIFLIWLYISWMVVMLGAEISYCLYHRSGARQHTSGALLLSDFKVIALIWQAQQQDQLLNEDELTDSKSMAKTDIQASLERMLASGLIHQTSDGQWALSKDSARLTLADLYTAQNHTLPQLDLEQLSTDPLEQALSKALTSSNHKIEDALRLQLQPLFQSAVRQPAPPAENQRIEP